MANTVTMRFRVLEDGSLQQIANQANQAAAGLDRTSEANTRLHRTTRGASNMQGNQTRAFAATANSAGGLVAAYATLMAHTFALTAAFGALQRASALDQLEQGLIAVGNAAGQNLPFVSRELQNITDGAITLKEAMEATALATSAGFSTSQLKDLTKVAKGASLALGRDMGDALTRLVKGTAKLEPEILDELGIMVRLDEASQKYADSIGKTITQLSRFEKQQAFLNATIEQGEKKFSAVFKAVDPEPFAQLSATFRDLVKEITGFINLAAIPLVNFLTSSPSALIAALLLFASSITKKITPALSEMAASSSRAAAHSANVARRSARVMSTAYTTAIAQVNANFKTVPRSVKAVETAFRSGSLSVQEYRTHLVNLRRSEQLRANAAVSNHAATASKRAAELAEIRALITATEQLIATEGRRTMTGGAGRRAQTRSRGSRRQAGALNAMENTGVAGGFVVAARASRSHFRDISRSTGALNGMSNALSAVGRSLSLFGSALLRLVPVLGQVLFVFSMLSPLFPSLKKSGLSKATDEVVKSFKSFSDIAAQLNEHLLTTENAEERFSAKLAVRVGVMDQIVSGMQKLIDVSKEEQSQQVKAALTARIAAGTKLRDRKQYIAGLKEEVAAEKKANNGRDTVKSTNLEFNQIQPFEQGGVMDGNSLAQLEAAEKNYQTRYEAALSVASSITNLQAKNLIEEAAAHAEAAGLTDVMQNELLKLKKIQESLGPDEELIISKDLIKQLQDALDPLNKLKNSMEGVETATETLFTKTLGFSEAAKGRYGELFTDVQALRNELLTAAKSAALTGDATPKVPEKTVIEAERLKKALNLTDKDLQGVTTYDGILTVVGDKIAANNVLISQSVGKSKQLNAEAKLLGKFSAANETAKKQELLTLNQALQVQLKGTQASIENTIATEGEASQSDKLLKLLQLRTNLTAQLKGTQDGTTLSMVQQQQVLVASVRQEKAKVDLLAKQASFSTSIAKSNLKIKQNELKVANLLAKKDAKEKRPAAAAKTLFDETKKDKLAIIESERKMKHASIKMEYKLLEAQTKLARAQAAEKNLDTAIYDELLQLQKGAQVLANQAANKAATAAASDLEVEGVTTNLAKEDEDKNIALDKRDRARDVLGSAASTMAGLGPEGESLSAGMEMIEGFSASFDTALSTMADSSATNSEKISAGLGVASSLIGGMMKMQQAATADKLRAIDQEIAAEKARDGQSAASAGKIKALEAKKTAVARKAFEDEKKMKIAQTIISTAQGAIAAYTSLAMIPIVGPALGAAAAAMVVSMGAKQISMIKATTFSGGGSVGGGPSSISIGSKNNTVDLANGNNQGGELAYARGGEGQGQMDNFTPAFTGYKNRAAGGNTGFIVGEQGPELFVPEVPGNITPAGETADMRSAPNNINFTIQAVDASGVESLLTEQRANIIRMIREAANEQGEPFLERVSETLL